MTPIPRASTVYRSLLKAVSRNITCITDNKAWVTFVREEFRRLATPTPDASRQQELLKIAEDYTFMIDGVRQHKELLLSYNVGIPTEDREKNMKKRAAALVGLALPPETQHE